MAPSASSRLPHAAAPRINDIAVSLFTVPTDAPESDGTLEWDSTTFLAVQVQAGAEHGLGYTYADAAAAALILDLLRPVLLDGDPMAIPALSQKLWHEVRNQGQGGLCAMAISALDVALWDLKARLLKLPLVTLLGQARDAVPIYGSGGFTSYSEGRLREQLGDWVRAGMTMVKMKVGREPEADAERVRWARRAIGPHAELFVDANGAYQPKQALRLAQLFAEFGVSWFEEPVVASDVAGLRFVRERLPARMELAAGEYGYTAADFRGLLDAGAVDVLQADATRCGGISGFLAVEAQARAAGLQLSAHCAPALHMHLGCALAGVRHLEYFHDHVRVEHLLLEGVPAPKAGQLAPDLERPGLGWELRSAVADRYAAHRLAA